MKIIKQILISLLISATFTSILYSNDDTDKIDKEENDLLSVISQESNKETVKLDIKKVEENETKVKKKKIKLADVAKETENKAKEEKIKEDEAKKVAKEKEKKARELEKKKPKRKLTLDEKRAILAIKKKKEQDAAEAKAEALYQQALKEAIESVR